MGGSQLVVVGGPGAGKTQLLRQLQAQLGGAELSPRPPADEYVPSAGAELVKVTLGQGLHSPAQVDLFDTPGSERWRALCDGYVSQAHGLVVVLEVFVASDDRGDSSARTDHVHAPSLATARSWLGRSLPTLLLGLRTEGEARPDLEPQELPRSEHNPESLSAQARAAGAIYAEVSASSAVGLEAALLGLTAAIDAERSRAEGQSSPPAAPVATVSGGSSASMNDSAGEVQKLLAGIGGVLDMDSSTESIEGGGGGSPCLGESLLPLPSRGSIYACFERHAGPGSQMSTEQFLELAEELWPGAEGLADSVQHAVVAAAATWPLERQGCKALLELVADIDQLGNAVGRRQGALPASLSVGDFTAGVRAAGLTISDEEAVGAFVKLGGAGGHADIEEVIAWLAGSCWSSENRRISSGRRSAAGGEDDTAAAGSPTGKSMGARPPPASPRDGNSYDRGSDHGRGDGVDDGYVDDDDESEEEAVEEVEEEWEEQAAGGSPGSSGGQDPAKSQAAAKKAAAAKFSMDDQEELMAKIEADPDNMDLLMQLQELHRSLSMVLIHSPTHPLTHPLTNQPTAQR